MKKTIDRLMIFIDHIGLSARQFDLSIGAGNGYILRMKKNRASIGSDIIERIILQYPQLNIVWLLTGKGSMLDSDKDLDLEYEKLSPNAKKEFEDFIDDKIKAHTNNELKKLLHEVNLEIEQLKNEIKNSN